MNSFDVKCIYSGARLLGLKSQHGHQTGYIPHIVKYSEGKRNVQRGEEDSSLDLRKVLNISASLDRYFEHMYSTILLLCLYVLKNLCEIASDKSTREYNITYFYFEIQKLYIFCSLIHNKLYVYQLLLLLSWWY